MFRSSMQCDTIAAAFCEQRNGAQPFTLVPATHAPRRPTPSANVYTHMHTCALAPRCHHVVPRLTPLGPCCAAGPHLRSDFIVVVQGVHLHRRCAKCGPRPSSPHAVRHRAVPIYGGTHMVQSWAGLAHPWHSVRRLECRDMDGDVPTAHRSPARPNPQQHRRCSARTAPNKLLGRSGQQHHGPAGHLIRVWRVPAAGDSAPLWGVRALRPSSAV